MLSMASIGSAGGAAIYYAKDNYYTRDESAESGQWAGIGAELLGLVEGEHNPDELGEHDPALEEEHSEIEPTADVDEEVHDAAKSDVDLEQAADKNDARDGGAGEQSNDIEVDEAAAPVPDTKAAGEHRAVASQDLFDEPEHEPAAEEGRGQGEGSSEPQEAMVDAQVSPKPAEDKTRGAQQGPHPAADGPTSSGTDSAQGQSNPDTGPESRARRGASGRVDAATLEAILNGRLPDGTQVGDPARRALGMDLTFSAPKSLSILGLVGGDTRLLDANMAATKAAMRFAERELAEGRVKENGKAIPVKTGNLVYALFEHDTSRAEDPQAHVHAVIANMTRMPDGSWKSLHNGQLWQNNTVIGSVYHAALRDNVQKLGYRVELTGKHGAFEIVGVSKAVRTAFSQRREEIMGLATKLGIATPQGMDTITRTTRDHKNNAPDREGLCQGWRARAEEIGFDPQQAIDASTHALSRPTSFIGRTLQTIEALAARFGAALPPSDPLLDHKGVARGASAGERTQLAVASAIRILEQKEAAFGVHQLTKTALDVGLSSVTPDTIAKRVSALIRQEKLAPGLSTRADHGVTLLTTSTALATERAILTNIELGKGAVSPVVEPDLAAHALTTVGEGQGGAVLNDEQLAAAASIISSSDRIVAVQGLAGAGKSTMLDSVAAVLDGYGKNAIGLAFQNKMVADLAEGTGLRSQTVASFLAPYERMIADGDSAGITKARREMRSSYVIVDEASMIPNRNMESLTAVANLLQLDRLVLVGDRQQLLSIDAGKSFALAQTSVATARMDTSLRQRTDQMRLVTGLTNRGQVAAAIDALGNAVTQTNDRVGTASSHWLGCQTICARRHWC